MKTIKSIAVAILITIAGTTISNAQVNEKQSKTPHGGIIQNSGDYKIERVERENNISFYVLNAKGKTVSNKKITGLAVFEFFNKTKATNPVFLDTNNALFVQVPKASIYAYCTITLLVNGKTISSKFKNSQVSEQDINHGHQH
ncbi:hypothetical protein EKL98_07830 [Flavobacterium bomense]|uniref:Uncharacterized protein n=1 Tax=Flavobacterium bomense TaxID=2497483 RepID=A0A3S0N078_9FLAO|nr:hypothetical protein [Flavobacterium bomense]RTZ04843.1 hypothetical protein EKL98_07830 [Flavobacterium bomense]